jgi:hypothetical protein
MTGIPIRTVAELMSHTRLQTSVEMPVTMGFLRPVAFTATTRLSSRA